MKKNYQKPSITRIELKYQQAVLTGCTRTTTSRSVSRSTYCTRNSCRRTNRSTGADSAACS